ncbi:MAG TPA: NAD(P)H-dependent glycerol-3-phosphate dehydrogenase [Solirubrobacteraceae bacterium]|nr:NAD(P)H-dependent glycerol-3-phosphate dehydrogenase [Solirubrobacteraceae bacterium]
MPPVPRPSIHLPAPGTRRATVIGAGSFGTAVAVILARGGLRTTLQTRSETQARELNEQRENSVYLSGVRLPRELRIEPASGGVARADYVFLSVPSMGLHDVIAGLEKRGLSDKASVISLAKGLVGPDGEPPTALLTRLFGATRVGCIGGPAHALEMVSAGAGLVAASASEELATAVSGVFVRAGVVCEQSDDPVGVELAGVAKNAAALASGATVEQGLNVAGAAAGHIFSEVWRWAVTRGASATSMIGLAGTGDLVATALAPESRNRRAGELLAEGVAAAEIPARVGQAVEALETVPLLDKALAVANIEAPVTHALAGLIDGRLPLDEWVAVVRTTIPPAARRSPEELGPWRRMVEWFKRLFRRE